MVQSKVCIILFNPYMNLQNIISILVRRKLRPRRLVTLSQITLQVSKEVMESCSSRGTPIFLLVTTLLPACDVKSHVKCTSEWLNYEFVGDIFSKLAQRFMGVTVPGKNHGYVWVATWLLWMLLFPHFSQLNDRQRLLYVYFLVKNIRECPGYRLCIIHS